MGRRVTFFKLLKEAHHLSSQKGHDSLTGRGEWDALPPTGMLLDLKDHRVTAVGPNF